MRNVSEDKQKFGLLWEGSSSGEERRDRDGHPSGEHTRKKDLTRGLLVTLTVEARDKGD